MQSSVRTDDGRTAQHQAVVVVGAFLRDFRWGWLRQHTDRAFMHSACSGSVSGGVSCKQMIW
jgi:hypothetical protein